MNAKIRNDEKNTLPQFPELSLMTVNIFFYNRNTKKTISEDWIVLLPGKSPE